jgi:hypothetical protein
LFLLQMRKPHRRLLALVAFCYLCLSIVLPLQHTDHFARPSASSVPAVGRSVGTSGARLAAQRYAHTALSRQDRCAACDWEAANLSAALPAFTLLLTPPQTPRVVTICARTLRLPAFPASSRAPPLA